MTPSKKLALDLLNHGCSKAEVARRVGVSRRTIIRWSKELSQNEIDLVAEADQAVCDEVDDLEEYRTGQRWFAIQLGSLASKLLPVIERGIENVNPTDISPRLLPSLVKALTELAGKSSDCWSRSTGIEARVKREVEEEISNLLSKLEDRLSPSIYAVVLSALKTETEGNALAFVSDDVFAEMATAELLRIANGDLTPLSDR